MADGKTQYRIKWMGYATESWEPEDNLSGCDQALEEHKTSGRPAQVHEIRQCTEALLVRQMRRRLQ
jgi:hypothetical protein